MSHRFEWSLFHAYGDRLKPNYYNIPFVPSIFKSKKISEVAVTSKKNWGANQVVFWLMDVYLYLSKSAILPRLSTTSSF